MDEAQIAEVGNEAQRFVDGLVAAFGLEATSALAVEGSDLEVTVEGENLGLLVGPRGVTLQAIQDLARVASQRRLRDHETRLRIDIGGYRKRRSESLARFVTEVAADVAGTGVARVLDPMSSADRKVIHDSLSTVEGISTRSEGEDPFRRVVIVPAPTKSSATSSNDAGASDGSAPVEAEAIAPTKSSAETSDGSPDVEDGTPDGAPAAADALPVEGSNPVEAPAPTED